MDEPIELLIWVAILGVPGAAIWWIFLRAPEPAPPPPPPCVCIAAPPGWKPAAAVWAEWHEGD